MSDKTEQERRDAFIKALREMAYFFEQHPGVKTPVYVCMNVFVNTREEIVEHARQSSWQKDYNDMWFNLRKEFGEDLRLEINASRETVCRKVVTGTRILPVQPERTVEEVEWVCDDASLLAAKS